jgi:hypothetical protein
MDIASLEKMLQLLRENGPLAVLLCASLLWAFDERKQRIYLQRKLMKLTAIGFARSKQDE